MEMSGLTLDLLSLGLLGVLILYNGDSNPNVSRHDLSIPQQDTMPVLKVWVTSASCTCFKKFSREK